MARELKELKNLTTDDFKDLDITDLELVQDLGANFVRMVTWQKVKDLERIKVSHVAIFGDIAHFIKVNGYAQALKVVKNGNLHKAYNLPYLYSFFGLDYKALKKVNKEDLLKFLA